MCCNGMYPNLNIFWNFFIHRHDQHAEQSDDGKWHRVSKPITNELLQQHLSGEKTIGVYQINNHLDSVKWVCFDIDNHDDTTDTTLILSNLSQTLTPLKHYVEASGSPDSYHVWLFTKPISTEMAYRFVRGIMRKAKLDIEAFPKQKSITQTQFGNQVKLPYGLNRRSKTFSHFLTDAQFEQVNIPYIRAEIPKIPTSTSTNSELYPCQLEWLNNKTQLEGGAGHHARFSLAANSLKSGKSIDEVISLFIHQRDFDHDYTQRTVTYIKNKRYYCSCEWIKSHCRDLLDPSICKRCKNGKKD